MTHPTPDASEAVTMLHRLIQPLIPHDPDGIRIRANGPALAVLSTERNMGALVGKHGKMVIAMRKILEPFGWTLEVVSGARSDAYTAPVQTSLPIIREMVYQWLVMRYGPPAFRITLQRDDEWNVVVHPDHFNDEDYSAIDTWSYAAARAQGGFFKVRLIEGGRAAFRRSEPERV